ncbi:MAG: dTDP-4-dehydrorhamnose reductase [Candidatus Marinimicrobia bacterium]|nr:dTDP-4-dehydrorhamnose reductase [Candidatus Neomarinimicrobiota bacterium]MBL7022721.1 dTDP-4-dehydrorhamnose reductase [Candidatus Neomarinimicrobiota bacterium]MBL7109150.1 dTDP-4-dehydrorhamnose reductase [Candidatus Neomarinimicrobiota bacterium]
MLRKILITGSSGQLGKSLISELGSDFELLPTDSHPLPITVSGLPIIEMDITNFDQVKQIVTTFAPDIIINSAAYTNVDGSEIDKNAARNVNVEGLENLIKTSSTNAYFVQISTDYVFDGENGPYDENAPTFPISYYGKTKLEAENVMRGSRRRNLILRPNVLYSSSIDDTASFFSWVFTQLSDKQEINVVTDQTSNPTWIPKFAETIHHCVANDVEGIYHYGSENYLSRFDFAIQIAEVFGLDISLIKPITTNELNQTAHRPKHSGMNPGKIQKELCISIYSTEFCLTEIKKIMEQK